MRLKTFHSAEWAEYMATLIQRMCHKYIHTRVFDISTEFCLFCSKRISCKKLFPSILLSGISVKIT